MPKFAETKINPTIPLYVYVILTFPLTISALFVMIHASSRVSSDLELKIDRLLLYH